MLVSTAVAGNVDGALHRAKMLLLLQILLPVFGLALGAALDPEGRHHDALRLAIFSVVALIVPAQLLATWLGGDRILGHSVFLFGVYQHLQFVPVILVCAYLAVLPGIWSRWGMPGKLANTAAVAFLAVYAVAANSVLAMFAVVAGISLFGAVRFIRARERAAAWMVAVMLGSFSGYLLVVKDTYMFHRKFSFLFPANDPTVWVGGYSMGARPRLQGGWQIIGQSGGEELMHLVAMERAGRARLVIAGELAEGGLGFSVRDMDGQPTLPDLEVTHKGPFQVELEIDRYRGDRSVRVLQRPGAARATIGELAWIFPPLTGRDADFRNVVERFSDWRLFGLGIIESPKSFLFGHSRPIAREQRTSAHNFYLDFIYNFGALALLPLGTLITYTAALLWRRRREVMSSDALFALAATVAFLVLVESNLKVSLRQPYPGIAIYFFWGLLLARLRNPEGAAAAQLR